MEKLISVIVPIYNGEKYLEECLESIINQTYKNLQIILIDDGSKDKSGKICDEYAKKDNRIEVIHKENAGVSVARNTGLDNARGEWITFIDADDSVEKDFCKKLMQKETNDVDCIMCGYNRLINDKKIEIKSIGFSNKFEDSRKYLISSLNPQTGVGFSHMKIIRMSAIGNIRFNDNLKVAEDALFNIQLSGNIRKINFVDEKLYNYRLNTNSTVKKYDDKYTEKYLKAMEECGKYIRIKYSNDSEIIQNYYNFVAYHVLLIAVNYCYNPQNLNKRKTLKKICKEAIFSDGIIKSNYENLSLTRKITLFTIKYKLYIATGIICRIRQFQNRRK